MQSNFSIRSTQEQCAPSLHHLPPQNDVASTISTIARGIFFSLSLGFGISMLSVNPLWGGVLLFAGLSQLKKLYRQIFAPNHLGRFQPFLRPSANRWRHFFQFPASPLQRVNFFRVFNDRPLNPHSGNGQGVHHVPHSGSPMAAGRFFFNRFNTTEKPNLRERVGVRSRVSHFSEPPPLFFPKTAVFPRLMEPSVKNGVRERGANFPDYENNRERVGGRFL